MKPHRHQAILQLIDENVIGNQEELRSQLKDLGFDVNIGTVSRDIRELAIVKSSFMDTAGHANFKYVQQFESLGVAPALAQVVNAFVEAVTAAEVSVDAIICVGLSKGQIAKAIEKFKSEPMQIISMPSPWNRRRKLTNTVE